MRSLIRDEREAKLRDSAGVTNSIFSFPLALMLVFFSQSAIHYLAAAAQYCGKQSSNFSSFHTYRVRAVGSTCYRLHLSDAVHFCCDFLSTFPKGVLLLDVPLHLFPNTFARGKGSITNIPCLCSSKTQSFFTAPRARTHSLSLSKVFVSTPCANTYAD